MTSKALNIYSLGRLDYEICLSAMQQFTQNRSADTEDELWMLEHYPIYTQGVAGKPQHLSPLPQIPVVQSDRGGQITYHGPGQLIVYTLLDLDRLNITIRELVTALESACIALLLHECGIDAYARRDAPGIYIDDKKIASLGLRVKKSRSYHGIAINLDMDLSPFDIINPCGLAGMQMTQVSDLAQGLDFNYIKDKFISHLIRILGYTEVHYFNQHAML